MWTERTLNCAPLLILGVTLVILLWAEIPAGNKDVIVAIVSGLLGYMAKDQKKES